RLKLPLHSPLTSSTELGLTFPTDASNNPSDKFTCPLNAVCTTKPFIAVIVTGKAVFTDWGEEMVENARDVTGGGGGAAPECVTVRIWLAGDAPGADT